MCLSDHQPQPGTTRLSGAIAVDPIKPIKNAGLIRSWDANPSILYLKNGMVFILSEADNDFDTWGSVLNGIDDEICQ